jgi:hypothetical protein
MARDRQERGRPRPQAAGPGPAARRSAPQDRASPRLPRISREFEIRGECGTDPASRWSTRPACGADVPAATAKRPAHGWRVIGRNGADRGRRRPDRARRPAGPPHKTGHRHGCPAFPASSKSGANETFGTDPASRWSTRPACGADVPAATAKRPAHGWRVIGRNGADRGRRRPDRARRPAGPPHKTGHRPGCRLNPRATLSRLQPPGAKHGFSRSRLPMAKCNGA